MTSQSIPRSAFTNVPSGSPLNFTKFKNEVNEFLEEEDSPVRVISVTTPPGGFNSTPGGVILNYTSPGPSATQKMTIAGPTIAGSFSNLPDNDEEILLATNETGIDAIKLSATNGGIHLVAGAAGIDIDSVGPIVIDSATSFTVNSPIVNIPGITSGPVTIIGDANNFVKVDTTTPEVRIQASDVLVIENTSTAIPLEIKASGGINLNSDTASDINLNAAADINLGASNGVIAANAQTGISLVTSAGPITANASTGIIFTTALGTGNLTISGGGPSGVSLSSNTGPLNIDATGANPVNLRGKINLLSAVTNQDIIISTAGTNSEILLKSTGTGSPISLNTTNSDINIQSTTTTSGNINISTAGTGKNVSLVSSGIGGDINANANDIINLNAGGDIIKLIPESTIGFTRTDFRGIVANRGKIIESGREILINTILTRTITGQELITTTFFNVTATYGQTNVNLDNPAGIYGTLSLIYPEGVDGSSFDFNIFNGTAGNLTLTPNGNIFIPAGSNVIATLTYVKFSVLLRSGPSVTFYRV